jgi:hypothetical protein
LSAAPVVDRDQRKKFSTQPVLFPTDTDSVSAAVGIFVGYLTAFRVLMVWVYDRTESLFVAMLMHVSITASLLILNPLGISGVHLLTYSFALAIAVWVIVGVLGVVQRTALATTAAEGDGSKD